MLMIPGWPHELGLGFKLGATMVVSWAEKSNRHYSLTTNVGSVHQRLIGG